MIKNFIEETFSGQAGKNIVLMCGVLCMLMNTALWDDICSFHPVAAEKLLQKFMVKLFILIHMSIG